MATLSAICPVLIGRTAQLDNLDRLMRQACSGVGQMVLIAGEAGVGKSRLIAEAVARFRASQSELSACELRVLSGRCFEPDRVLPYAPLLEIVRADLATRSRDQIAAWYGADAGMLTRLLPELAEILPGTPPPVTDTMQDQRQLTHALVRCLARLGTHGEQPRLITRCLIVEDLHWSDDASLAALLALARQIESQPIALLLTYRTDEVQPELAAFLAALDREHLATEITLSRLALADAATMIGTILSAQHQIPEDLLESIYGVTEGNPFFVEEMLKSLLVTGEIAAPGDALDTKPFSELRLPRSVQLAVQRRLQQVNAEAREILILAAIAGRRFDFDLLQSVTGRDEARLLELIKQLINAQLVVEESADVFAFRHALTRAAVEADLLARERRTLHRAIADALEHRSGDTPDRHLADLAEHYFAAEMWGSALQYAQRAGTQAHALYAPRAAIKQFDRAIEAARRLGNKPPPEVCLARGHAHELLGDFERAHQDFANALAVAQASANHAAEWQSLIALGFLWSGRDFAQTGAYFQRALHLAQQMGDQTTIAHSLNRLGNWHMMIEQPVEARRHHETALAMFETLQDQRGLAETLDLLGTTSMSAGDPLRGAVYYQRAVTLFRNLNDQPGVTSALTMMALCGDQYLANTYLAAENDRTALSLGYVEEALATAHAIDWRSAEALASAVRGQVLCTAGAYGRALDAMQASLHIAVEIEHAQWQLYAHLMLGALYLDLLSLAPAYEHFAHALALAGDVGSLYWRRTVASFWASACVLQGEHDRANTLLQDVLEPDMPALTMAQRHAWCALAELALARNNPKQAQTILDRLYAAAANIDPHAEHTIPRLAMLRADALVALGRLDQAETLLESSLATARWRGIRGGEWRILARLAALYQRQHRRDAAESAGSAARAIILDIAASLTDETLRETFVHRAKAQLERLPPASPRRAAKQEYGGLTTREREVAALIAQGYSNRALADALVVSERTIAKHVENILSKLGFSARAQVAAWAVEKSLAKRDERLH
jgi:DNA-binding CsgD family transcriptional regulator